MSKVHQIHFEVTPKRDNFIKKYAKRDNISLSEYYRRSAFKQAKKEALIDKVHHFDQELAHDNAMTINSKKDFIKWLQK